MAILGQAVEQNATPGGYGESPYGAGGYGVATAVRPAKVVHLGQAEELGTARVLGRAKTCPVVAAEEVATAAAVAARHIVRVPLGQVAEDALAGGFTRRKVRRIARADETHEAGEWHSAGEPIPPTVLTATHRRRGTLATANGGRSRLEARHG